MTIGKRNERKNDNKTEKDKITLNKDEKELNLNALKCQAPVSSGYQVSTITNYDFRVVLLPLFCH